jgi:predicted Zn-dependent peptidase
MASNEGLASTLMYLTSYQLGDDYLLNFPAAINAVRPAEIVEAARRYWLASGTVLAVAGDYQLPK